MDGLTKQIEALFKKTIKQAQDFALDESVKRRYLNHMQVDSSVLQKAAISFKQQ